MTTIAFVPQVIKVWRSGSAADISTAMYVIFLSGLILWTIYGFCIESWPIVVANVITSVLAAAVLAMKMRFSRGR